MKTAYLALLLAVLGGHAWAQVGELYDAEVTQQTSITDPAIAMNAAEGQWLAFSLPVLEGTRSPCCWKGKWNGMGEAGCSLESKHQSYGTRSDSPLAENVIVFSQIHAGQVHDLRVVGEFCPVAGNGAQVIWIDRVDQTAGLDWLETVARTGGADSSGGSALFAFALHRSVDAGERLFTLAKDSHGDLSQEAIFWLGEARGEEGFELLKRLLAELPRGEKRREINFALSQNSSSQAGELLFKISRSDPDPEQRGEALFWLAQEYPEKARDWLLVVIATEQDEDVREQAVFAISQLPADIAGRMLLDLATDNQIPRDVRRQALFWMSQSDDDNTVVALTELLTR